MIFYMLAAGGRFARLHSAVFRIPYYFALVNLAALRGFFRAVNGRETVLWRKAGRVMESHVNDNV